MKTSTECGLLLQVNLHRNDEVDTHGETVGEMRKKKRDEEKRERERER